MRGLVQTLREMQETETISMTIPLFIRCMEWAREEAKDDVVVHKFTENATAIKRVLDTDDYEKLVPKD